MSKLKKGKLPFETYYEKMISLPVVNSCTYHKPYTVAYLFVISAIGHLSESDNKMCEENTNKIMQFLESGNLTAEEMDVYYNAVELFSKIIRREIAPRGDWFFYDLGSDNIIQRLYLCFGDLIINPDCINYYANSSIVCGEFRDQMTFSVEFDEVFCLTVEYTDLL